MKLLLEKIRSPKQPNVLDTERKTDILTGEIRIEIYPVAWDGNKILIMSVTYLEEFTVSSGMDNCSQKTIKRKTCQITQQKLPKKPAFLWPCSEHLGQLAMFIFHLDRFLCKIIQWTASFISSLSWRNCQLIKKPTANSLLSPGIPQLMSKTPQDTDEKS